MFRRMALLRFALPLLLHGVASAGVLVVGSGPGAQFADLQDAIDAAQPNDAILVQPGVYGGIEVGKPLRILGDGTGSVRIESSTLVGVAIHDIGGSEELVLSGVEVMTTPQFPTSPNVAVKVTDSLGTVVLHDVHIDPLDDPPPGATLVQRALVVTDSARVLVLSSVFLNAGVATLGQSCGVLATHATLWVVDSTITGRHYPDGINLAGVPAVRLEGATLDAWRSTLVGGDGTISFDAAVAAVGGAAIDALDSDVSLYGGPVGEVRGGDGGHSFSPFPGYDWDGGPAVRLLNSSLMVQADLPLLGGLDGSGTVQAPAIDPPGAPFTSDPRRFPTLTTDAEQASVGGAFAATLEGTPGALQFLFISFETGPSLELPGAVGIGLLDPTLFFALGSTVLGPGGSATVPLAVPLNPHLLGRTLFLQAVEVASTQLGIGSPALVGVTL